MIVRRYQDLECWRLAVQVKREVYAIICRPNVAADFKFCDQIRDSARSGPSNIAEGFGRYKPPQFRQFLDIAIASLTETANHLRDGVDRRHFTAQAIQPLLPLAARARGAAIGLKAYLKDAKPPEPRRRRRPRKPQAPPNQRT